MTPLHQFTGAILDYFLARMIQVQQRLTLTHAYAERSLSVLLENEILQQIGDHSPRRISTKLTVNPESLLSSQSTIARAAVSENGYLRQIAHGSETVLASIHIDDDIFCLSGDARAKPAT